MKVENIINNRGNRATNQFVITHNGDTYFQSYESVIAKYDKDGRLTITPLWDCSVTTRKHFYIFLADYTTINPTRENVLRCIENGYIKVVKDGELDF